MASIRGYFSARDTGKDACLTCFSASCYIQLRRAGIGMQPGPAPDPLRTEDWSLAVNCCRGIWIPGNRSGGDDRERSMSLARLPDGDFNVLTEGSGIADTVFRQVGQKD